MEWKEPANASRGSQATEGALLPLFDHLGIAGFVAA